MQNNFTLHFKSNTVQHGFLIIQSPESFNLEKSYFSLCPSIALLGAYFKFQIEVQAKRSSCERLASQGNSLLFLTGFGKSIMYQSYLRPGTRISGLVVDAQLEEKKCCVSPALRGQANFIKMELC